MSKTFPIFVLRDKATGGFNSNRYRGAIECRVEDAAWYRTEEAARKAAKRWGAFVVGKPPQLVDSEIVRFEAMEVL